LDKHFFPPVKGAPILEILLEIVFVKPLKALKSPPRGEVLGAKDDSAEVFIIY